MWFSRPREIPGLPAASSHSQRIRELFRSDCDERTQACKTGAHTVCPIEFGCEMTEVALLGALALRTGRYLEWDAAAMRVTNDDEANEWVNPAYRKGWVM